MKVRFALLLAAALAGPARAATFTNAPDADAFVRAAAPAVNYGAAGALAVSGAAAVNGAGVSNGVYDTFMRFNTAALTTNFNSLFGSNNWVINGATLHVTEVGAPNNAMFNRGTGAFEIRWLANDNWTEGSGTPLAPTTNGVTYNDEPALLDTNTDLSLGVFTNAGVNGPLDFALALPPALVNDLRAGGEVGFFLTTVDSQTGFTFDGRNYISAPARPFLTISAVPRPGIRGIRVSAAGVALDCANGAAGGTYDVLSSTNAALPLNQWPSAATEVLTAAGDFSVTVTNAPGAQVVPRQFFILRTR